MAEVDRTQKYGVLKFAINHGLMEVVGQYYVKNDNIHSF
jgi:hypothetical protein